MKLVRFLIGSLLVAGMLAVAPAAFADEDGGERGPREVSNKDQGGTRERGARNAGTRFAPAASGIRKRRQRPATSFRISVSVTATP